MKSDFIFIKPTEGRTVLNPLTNEPIKPNGELVQKCNHIYRCIRSGDCVIAKAPKPEKESVDK